MSAESVTTIAPAQNHNDTGTEERKEYNREVEQPVVEDNHKEEAMVEIKKELPQKDIVDSITPPSTQAMLERLSLDATKQPSSAIPAVAPNYQSFRGRKPFSDVNVVPPTPLEGNAQSNPFSVNAHKKEDSSPLGAGRKGYNRSPSPAGSFGAGRKGYNRSPSPHVSPRQSPKLTPSKYDDMVGQGRKGYNRSPSPSPIRIHSRSPVANSLVSPRHMSEGMVGQGRKGYNRSPTPSPAHSPSLSPAHSPYLSPAHSREPSPARSSSSVGAGRKGYNSSRSPSPSPAHSPAKSTQSAHSRRASAVSFSRKHEDDGRLGQGRKGYNAPLAKSAHNEDFFGGWGGRKGYNGPQAGPVQDEDDSFRGPGNRKGYNSTR